jgi:hypothetical protein
MPWPSSNSKAGVTYGNKGTDSVLRTRFQQGTEKVTPAQMQASEDLSYFGL